MIDNLPSPFHFLSGVGLHKCFFFNTYGVAEYLRLTIICDPDNLKCALFSYIKRTAFSRGYTKLVADVDIFVGNNV